LLPAVLSGALLWVCYHPLAWGWLAWVALVPLLCLVRSDRLPRRIYLSAWVGGGLFFWAALQWMRVADYRMYATWAMLAVYCSLYFPAAIYLTRVLERRTPLPLAVTFPVVWVALEYFRSFFGTGFSWYLLAHSQHDYLSIIQVADLGGSVTVSLLVAAVNAVVFDAVYQFEAVRRCLGLGAPRADQRTFGDDWPDLGGFFLASCRRGLLLDGFVVAVAVTAAVLYGGWRLQQAPAQLGPAVALLQGNLDQRIRLDAELPSDKQEAARISRERAQQALRKVFAEYDALCKLAIRSDPTPELFIWPETSDPFGWTEVSRELPFDQVPEAWRLEELKDRQRFHEMFLPLRPQFEDGGQGSPIPQLLGISTHFLDHEGKLRRYNSALLLNRGANPDGRYDKMHRVPFGEYVPLRDWLPFMNYFAPYDFEYSIRSGENFTRFRLGEYRFGVLICYEDTDPFLAPHYARAEDDGPPVDFLVNISNDGWFDGSSEHEEHLAVSRFRAIECRRALVRSVNMGISAVIDGNGRVLRPEQANRGEALPLWDVNASAVSLPHRDWAAFKRVSGVLVARVPIDGRSSMYAATGDWLPTWCWVVIGFGTVGTWAYRRLRPLPQA
jgi:apolipoprotein N-acyltransferase